MCKYCENMKLRSKLRNTGIDIDGIYSPSSNYEIPESERFKFCPNCGKYIGDNVEKVEAQLSHEAEILKSVECCIRDGVCNECCLFEQHKGNIALSPDGKDCRDYIADEFMEFYHRYLQMSKS